MESASNVLSSQTENDVLLPERNTLLWGAFLLGVVLGFVGVYIVVAQPMFDQLGELGRQTQVLQADITQLVGVRNEAWEAGSLLADLKTLKSQIVDARATLRELKQLRQDVLEETRHTSAAAAALRDLARLQKQAIEQQELSSTAALAIEQMGRVQQQLTQSAGSLPLAKSAAGELLALKDQLVVRSHDIDSARTQANRLFVLQNELTAHSDQSAAAFENLDRLVEIKDRLIAQTPQLAGTVQNLDILSDFQEDFAGQLDSLSQIRESLTQVLLMEGTIGRVVRALQPLSQIINVKRLSDDDLRAAARAILDDRATRLSSRPESPAPLSRTAENDPFQVPQEEARYLDDLTDLGASADQSPRAIPLPVTDTTTTQ